MWKTEQVVHGVHLQHSSVYPSTETSGNFGFLMWKFSLKPAILDDKITRKWVTHIKIQLDFHVRFWCFGCDGCFVRLAPVGRPVGAESSVTRTWGTLGGRKTHTNGCPQASSPNASSRMLFSVNVKRLPKDTYNTDECSCVSNHCLICARVSISWRAPGGLEDMEVEISGPTARTSCHCAK